MRPQLKLTIATHPLGSIATVLRLLDERWPGCRPILDVPFTPDEMSRHVGPGIHRGRSLLVFFDWVESPPSFTEVALALEDMADYVSFSALWNTGRSQIAIQCFRNTSQTRPTPEVADASAKR